MKKLLAVSVLVSIIASGSLLVNSGVTIAEGSVRYKDKLPAWAKSDIEYVANKGYMKGDDKGNFRPNATISRAEFAAILARASNNTPDETRTGYSSIPGWSQNEVNIAVSKGFISTTDYPNGFNPDTPLTRRELAKWLSSGLAAKEEDFSKALKDTADTLVPVAEYYKGGLNKSDYPFVSVAMGTGLMTGYPDGRFGPSQTTTRAEAAVILRRFEAVQNKKPDAFQDLKEFREVGLTGTNAISMGYKYGIKINGEETSFDKIRNRSQTLYNNISSAKIKHFIIARSTAEPSTVSNLYGKMFMDKDYNLVQTMSSDHYEYFVEVAYTSHVTDMNASKYLNASTQAIFTLPGFRSGAVTKYGYSVLPIDYKINGSFLEKNKEVLFWTAGSINNKYVDNVTMNGVNFSAGDATFMIYLPKE